MNEACTIEFNESLNDMLFLFWEYLDGLEFDECTDLEKVKAVNFFTKTYIEY